MYTLVFTISASSLNMSRSLVAVNKYVRKYRCRVKIFGRYLGLGQYGRSAIGDFLLSEGQQTVANTAAVVTEDSRLCQPASTANRLTSPISSIRYDVINR